MAALGDKVSASILAQIETFRRFLVVATELNRHSTREGLSQKKYLMKLLYFCRASIKTADMINYPVMIKSSEGGGGKVFEWRKMRKSLKPILTK